jgi:hypothetical protein
MHYDCIFPASLFTQIPLHLKLSLFWVLHQTPSAIISSSSCFSLPIDGPIMPSLLLLLLLLLPSFSYSSCSSLLTSIFLMSLTFKSFILRRLFCFILISWGGASQVQLFFFFWAMSQFDWPIAKNKLKLWRLPQNRRFYVKLGCLSLWPTYIGEKGMTLAKTYHIKLRCYWEPIGNLKGT